MAEIIEIGEGMDTFDVVTWKSKHGSTYPSPGNVPAGLQHARDKAFVIPPELRSLIPESTTTIAMLLQHEVIHQVAILNTTKPSAWFSNDVPHTSVTVLVNRPIPDAATLDKLNSTSSQAWLSGCQSFVDHRFNNGRDHLPLGTLTFWNEMSECLKHHNAWKGGVDWVTSKHREWAAKPETADLVKNTNIFLTLTRITMGSTIRTCWGALSVNSLPRLLGESGVRSWMSDELVDMMMNDIAGRLKGDEMRKGRIWVLPTMIAQSIMTYGGSLTVNKQLQKWEKLMSEAKAQMAYLPFNINGNHWITFRVDLENGTVTYGDSLAWKRHPQPKKQLKAVRKWMVERMKVEKPQVDSSGLECANQLDTVSCGLVTANTIAVDIFNDKVIDPKRTADVRLAWFVKLTKTFSPPLEEELKALPEPATVRPHVKMSLASLLNPVGSATNSRPALDSHTEAAGDAPVAPAETTSTCSLTKSGASPEGDIEMDINKARTREDAHHAGEEGRIEMVEIEEGVWASRESSPADELQANEGGKDDVKEEAMDVDAAKAYAGTEPSAKQLGKRPRAPSVESGDIQEDNEREANVENKSEGGADKPREKRKKKKRSAAYTTEARRAYKDGALVPDEDKVEAWRDRIRAIEPYGPHVTFYDDDHTKFWCPKCQKKCSVKELNDVTRFRSHIKSCKGQYCMPKLTGFFKAASSSSEAKPKPIPRETVICQGLSARDDSCIATYLDRTAEQIRDEQEETRTWRNDYNRGRVYAKDCVGKFVALPDGPPKPCAACKKIFDSAPFKAAIGKPLPKPENRIYLNKQYINERLGKLFNECKGLRQLVEDDDASKSPYLRYALGVLAGKYNDETFNGFVEAYVRMKDREAQGKGMQNFKYTPQFLAFCQDIRTTNPAAYRGLQTVFQMPTEGTLEKKLADEPRFPYELCDRNFDLVQQHLETIAYDGPVGLGCDDTKLSTGQHLVWDAISKSHFLIGGSAGPVQVLNVDEVEKAMNDAETRPATKLRLWVLSIPYPKIPPVIVAAQAIPDNFDAQDPCRSLPESNSGIDLSQERVEKFKIPSPAPDEGIEATEVIIPVFDGQHVAIGQDSKHGLKTFRNNLYSGARLLTLGNFVGLYARIRDMALNEASPLYPRDVDKVDRQDDSAATRLFSADVLEFISRNHPDYLAEIIYLFVFGELIDAYQNRFITHHERVKMVLRALHFLNHWEMYLKVSDLPKSAHTISAQAIDITRTLINGYLALLHIHRDVLKGKFPFLPWLHSTEPCEHIFGEARRIIKEFTFRDFIYMVPKLKNRIRQLMRHFQVNPKARAVGYVHTYFDTGKLNALNLAIFPTLAEMGVLSAEALAEVESLLFLLGIIPSRLRERFAGFNSTQPLPSVNTWYHNSLVATRRTDTTSDNDSSRSSDSDDDNASVMSTTSSQEELDTADTRQKLNELLEEPTDHLYEFAQRKLTALRAAAFTLDADDFTLLQAANLQGGDEDTQDAEDTQNEQEVAQELNITIRDIVVSEQSAPLGLRALNTFADLDLTALVEIRRAHETEQAAKSGRTRTHLSSGTTDGGENNPNSDDPTTTRKRIYEKFNEILKDKRNHVPTPGFAARTERWTSGGKGKGASTSTSMSTAQDTVSGNAANAQAVAAASATKAATKRRKIFEAHKVPCLNLVSDARVSAVRPIRAGDFAFFVSDSPKPGTISVAKVLALYTRTAGKGARNAAATDVTNISALSRVAVQVFEHSHFAQFTSIPASTAALSTNKFLLLPPFQILCLLSNAPSQSSDTGTSATAPVYLSTTDFNDWKTLKEGGPSFVLAIKTFKKRDKGAGEVDEGD
ncbi:hypothetical protein FA13DRAFT_1794026 [Coprinellus micaceus]|uniref:Ubiquitin-like protease family profile domain-containing protein n=1 Tax=Coprinellus micaceus TaxID=71717 RepID=A0A4Y7T331_COPMI|nr:hypothetical protein FA13DRAFT_1794026 [Coprinellus micaceus]